MNRDVEDLGEYIGDFFVREKLAPDEILAYLREAAEMIAAMIAEAEATVAYYKEEASL